jgi:hypothetical protein
MPLMVTAFSPIAAEGLTVNVKVLVDAAGF